MGQELTVKIESVDTAQQRIALVPEDYAPREKTEDTPVEVERPSAAAVEAPSARLPGPDGSCQPLAPIRIAAPHEAAR